MNSQKNIDTLRVQLLAMSRLSQRALDDSVKGYGMRNLDFSRHVRTAHGELEEHHGRMKELCRELMNGGVAKASDSRFAFAALNIGTALHAIYAAAADIARYTTYLLESGSIQPSKRLEDTAQLVNRSMRLCTVALFEKDTCHAETVLRHLESLELRELAPAGTGPHRTGRQDGFEHALTRSLGEVAKQVHEMAESIVFWLEGNSCIAVPAGDKHFAVALPPARQQKSAATLSYMQSEKLAGPKIRQTAPC